MNYKLSDKDRVDTERVSAKLMKGLMCCPVNVHQALIESYLQEAIVYAHTGHWELEEAAAKIEMESATRHTMNQYKGTLKALKDK